MKCPACGAECHDNDKFCTECSAPLSKTAAALASVSDVKPELSDESKTASMSVEKDAPVVHEQETPSEPASDTPALSSPAVPAAAAFVELAGSDAPAAPEPVPAAYFDETGKKTFYSEPRPLHTATVSNALCGDPRKNWAGISSTVLGAISMCCCCTGPIGFICAVLAVVFGIIGLRGQKRDLSVVGIVLGSVGLLFCIALVSGCIMMYSGFPENLDGYFRDFGDYYGDFGEFFDDTPYYSF